MNHIRIIIWVLLQHVSNIQSKWYICMSYNKQPIINHRHNARTKCFTLSHVCEKHRNCESYMFCCVFLQEVGHNHIRLTYMKIDSDNICINHFHMGYQRIFLYRLYCKNQQHHWCTPPYSLHIVQSLCHLTRMTFWSPFIVTSTKGLNL